MGQYLNLGQFHALEHQAEDILARFREEFGFPNKPPVPVEMIAQALLSLQCESGELGRSDSRTVGVISVDDGLIYVDERCNWCQHIFTVSHEIGHQVLHDDDHHFQLRIANSQGMRLGTILGSTRAKTKKEKAELREIEANRLAAALLMPRPFLFSEARKYSAIDARAICELARAFDVSISTMLYRIKNLSKYQAWSGPRIDWDSLHAFESVLTEYWHSEKHTKYPSSMPSGSDDDVTTSASTKSRRRPRDLSVRRSKAAKAFDFLTQLTCRQWLGELPSLQAPGSTEVHPWQSFDHDFGASPIGKRKSLAEVIFDYLREGHKDWKRDGKRPSIIELAGTPNSGKDTLIWIVKDYLEDVHGYRVRVFDEGIKSCHINKWLDIDRLYKTVALAVIQLYEASLENPGNYDFVIFNRGLFDRLAFLHAMRICGRISQEQERVHQDYLLSYAHLQDATFLFLTSPEESIQRETERSLVNRLFSERDKESEDEPRDQRISNKEMLAQLNSSYLHVYRTYKELFHNQVYLFDFTDGDDASILEKARALADATLPRHSTQPPFPELFGFYYARKPSPGNRDRVSRQRLSQSSAEVTAQLSFSWH
jgi:Zn-dependent peptidase ImmA (M78 family)